MNYKDLDIKRSYETTGNNTHLLDEFYIPMLECSSNYFRIAGFFSSSSLAIAAKGIEGLIHNDGKMRLLISPRISEQDWAVMCDAQNLNDVDLEFLKGFKVDDFSKLDNLQALAWMLANNRLEIKVVVDKNASQSIFHQKIGIGFDMEGNILSFSGSINETAQAWLSNIEEFKTFKSWEQGQLSYVYDDLEKFNSYWNDEKQDTAKVFDLPTSLQKEIINVAPKDINDLAIMKRYKQREKNRTNEISLFSHQSQAVKEWQANDNKLLMEMATGTGKTRTAIGCFLTQLNKIENYLVIVATPQNTLSKQWRKDIEEELNIKFEISQIIDGSISKWVDKFKGVLLDLNNGLYNNAIIYSTHDTISNAKFIDVVNRYKSGTKILFICDEVHGIGSDNQRKALLDAYEYRVGLSATPERMFDEEGTKIVRDYFGGKSFVFDISDALGNINPFTGKPFLNPYYYYPIFVDLTDEEKTNYLNYTKKIVYLMSKKDVEEEDANLQKILRANILKNAEGKFTAVKELINSLNINAPIKDTIIFATERQAEAVLEYLGHQNITRCKITEEESTSKKLGKDGLSEREEYINQFRNGNIQVLLGLKCLDEGIDIKNARIAILMASSTNPREYVQRIGRVIRPAPNKKYSEIYDIIVAPSENNKLDLSIIEKEAKRALYVAKNAINYDEVKQVFIDKGVSVENYD